MAKTYNIQIEVSDAVDSAFSKYLLSIGVTDSIEDYLKNRDTNFINNSITDYWQELNREKTTEDKAQDISEMAAP